MENCFRGEIRFINARRRTDVLEVVLPVRVIRGDSYVFIWAGPLGSVMCRMTAVGTYEGGPQQAHRRLPIHLVIRDIHDLAAERSIRIFFEGFATTAADPSEVPGIPFIHGQIEARLDVEPD